MLKTPKKLTGHCVLVLIASLGLSGPAAQANSGANHPETAAPGIDMPEHNSKLSEEQQQPRSWKSKLKTMAVNSAANVEEFADVAWTRFTNRLGMNEPRYLANYIGYGNEDYIWVTGRLLANKPMGGPKDDDNWFDNLRSSYKRWNSKEIPGATVRLSYNGQTIETETDNEGYYRARFDRTARCAARTSVLAEVQTDDEDALSALHPVYCASASSDFMVISDMDDTIIHTGITDLLVAAQLTFLNNARTRKPLTGVASLYRALTEGPSGTQNNPVFYVSNSAWNMYDLLRDFVDLNGLPTGPIMLRDIGLTREGEGSRDHKINTIRQILERFPKLPAVLVGDSGQHDAEIYSKIAKEFPGRLLAIYIRDIDPDGDSAFDAKVDAIIKDYDDGVPFLRVADSALIAEHAHKLGLLSQKQVADIATDTMIDKQRDTLGEEALDEAIAMDIGQEQ